MQALRDNLLDWMCEAPDNLNMLAERLQAARNTKNQQQRQAKAGYPNDHAKQIEYCKPYVEAWQRAMEDYDTASTNLDRAEKEEAEKPKVDAQALSTMLEELRINMLMDVGLCCKEEYIDYCGRIINRQFLDLKKQLNLPAHQSGTAVAFAKAFGIETIVDVADPED